MGELIDNLGFRDILLLFMAGAIGLMYFDSKPAPVESKGSSYEQIAINVARAQTELVEKIVLPKLTAELEARIQANNVKMLGTIETTVRGNRVGRTSDNTESTKKYGREKKDVYWKYKDSAGDEAKFPIGSVIYDPKKEGDNRWLGLAYGLTFDTTIVQQKKYDGTYETFVETWAKHNKLKSSHGGGGRYPLEINSSKFQMVEPNTLVWSWFNPTMSLGIGASSASEFWGVGKLNFMNYGYEKQLPVYQFLSPTLFVNNGSAKFGIEAASVNIGEFVPLIKDLHIGAGLMIPDYKSPFITLTTVF